MFLILTSKGIKSKIPSAVVHYFLITSENQLDSSKKQQ